MEKPVIDWDLGLKLSANNREMAEDMLAMLTKNLKEEVKQIRDAYTSNQIEKFKIQIHKLHGATCYCGVPRLKEAAMNLEFALNKNTMNDVPALLEKLEVESRLLLEAMENP